MRSTQSPETEAAQKAEADAGEVILALDAGYGQPGNRPVALGLIAVAASIDALRVALCDRLDRLDDLAATLEKP